MKTNPNDPATSGAPTSFSGGLMSSGGWGFSADDEPASGLTKREHFAALAMQGLWATAWAQSSPADVLTKEAVLIADALIAALNAKEGV